MPAAVPTASTSSSQQGVVSPKASNTRPPVFGATEDLPNAFDFDPVQANPGAISTSRMTEHALRMMAPATRSSSKTASGRDPPAAVDVPPVLAMATPRPLKHQGPPPNLVHPFMFEIPERPAAPAFGAPPRRTASTSTIPASDRHPESYSQCIENLSMEQICSFLDEDAENYSRHARHRSTASQDGFDSNASAAAYVSSSALPGYDTDATGSGHLSSGPDTPSASTPSVDFEAGTGFSYHMADSAALLSSQYFGFDEVDVGAVPTKQLAQGLPANFQAVEQYHALFELPAAPTDRDNPFGGADRWAPQAPASQHLAGPPYPENANWNDGAIPQAGEHLDISQFSGSMHPYGPPPPLSSFQPPATFGPNDVSRAEDPASQPSGMPEPIASWQQA